MTQVIDGTEVSIQHFDNLRRIDESVVQLLQSAGSAIDSLTRARRGEGFDNNDSISLEERKRQFTAAASNYFDTLSSIDTSLRREINALATAKILPADPNTTEVQGQDAKPSALSPQAIFDTNRPRPQDSRRTQINGGGLGHLDVGRLNSKNDNVGREKERELWDEGLGVIKSAAVEIDEKKATVVRDDAGANMMEEESSIMRTDG